ncbi:hypothetical protein GY45DRAFT_1269651 [Cubamyces sp. BRFM 1775]|nr:hypothetical protein GY45DRAFT_1269651 [Cubamyces sp. BRFM 1775]
MDTPSTSAAALKLQIQQLESVINRRKAAETPPTQPPAPSTSAARTRSNVYINPNYKPPPKTAGPPVPPPQPRPVARPPPTQPQEKRDVILNGVEFESSGRALVRKDLPRPPRPPPTATTLKRIPRPGAPQSSFRTKAGVIVNPNRAFKSKVSKRGRPMNRNMTLNNTRRPFQSRKKAKYSDKPCPQFTSTGVCNRGLTCMYQHDPSKIAICWAFLKGNCPHSAETCQLSHDPTPQRTPLCVHFANNGRCTRANCPFPHVRIGPREGICRDFAVLGYCEKGLDCDKQHVRECPDFAEKGQCVTKGCKLPHVIRASRQRKAAEGVRSAASSSAKPSASGMTSDAAPTSAVVESADDDTNGTSSSHRVTAEDGNMGDEFISLTFHEEESDQDEEDDDEDEEDGSEEYEDDEEDDVEEGQAPHSDNAAEHVHE